MRVSYTRILFFESYVTGLRYHVSLYHN